MNKKNLLNTIALSGALSLGSVANAETMAGLELRWNFNDAPTLGLVVKDVNFRDVKTSSSRSSSSNFDAAPVYTGINDIATSTSPTFPDISVGDSLDVNVYNGTDNRITSTSTRTNRFSDKIQGYELGIHFPLNKDWKKPAVELKGLVGKVNSYGGLGLGYDFKTDEVTIPASYSNGNLSIGTNLRHPVQGAYISASSHGAFKKLDETTTSNSTDSTQLCTTPGQNYVVIENNTTGNNYSDCE